MHKSLFRGRFTKIIKFCYSVESYNFTALTELVVLLNVKPASPDKVPPSLNWTYVSEPPRLNDEIGVTFFLFPYMMALVMYTNQ